MAKDNKDIPTNKVHRHLVMRDNDLIQSEIKSLLKSTKSIGIINDLNNQFEVQFSHMKFSDIFSYKGCNL